jgi:hypothetical protein
MRKEGGDGGGEGGGGRQSEGRAHPTENSLGPECARTAKNLQNRPTEFPQLPTTSFPFALGTMFLLGKP